MFVERGKVWNAGYATQVRDYSGLRWGAMTPTDIDGVLDYHGKGWMVLELKHHDTPLSIGQRIALERLCDDLGVVRPTLGIVACHHQEHGEIDAAQAVVVMQRKNRRWLQVDDGRTVKQVMDRFIAKLDNKDAAHGSEKETYGR